MKILSHRGFWLHSDEKNTVKAFDYSFSNGFGIETDVRDYDGRLVVSHDVPVHEPEISFEGLLNLVEKTSNPSLITLAINVKSDGLASYFRKVLDEHQRLDLFFFDMSVPDMRGYFEHDLPVFGRVSEVEKTPAWLYQSKGVWLDAFNSTWFNNDVINHFLSLDKKVCVVSPELHGRQYQSTWEMLKLIPNTEQLVLCTDYPQIANKFFNN